MNPHYNQNYSEAQVADILQKIQHCVKNNRYTIAQNEKRKENVEFIKRYNISDAMGQSILLQIDIKDFCHSLQNTNLGFEHEILYVFAPQINLLNHNDEEEMVDIYTKFNLIDMENKSRALVISFHKLNNPIEYLFR